MCEHIWIDALEFAHYGGWKADTQFTHLMGAGYLLACGSPGTPVADAHTSFAVPAPGHYRLWVRTKNWYYPHSPGTFTLSVDGAGTGAVLGGLPSQEWLWQLAGDFDLQPGEHTLRMMDKTGYFGRFAAVLVTPDMDFVPPRPVAEMERLRAACKGLALAPVEEGHYALVVAGAGPGGIPAAIAAARAGVKCLVLTNRPVVGGNGSTEAGVHFNGASARQPNAREGGIMEEIMRTAAYHGCSFTKAMEMLCAAEENLTIRYNLHVVETITEGGRITAVVARHTLNGTRHRFTGEFFVDATGDGWLLHQAGAKYRLGREAAWQHGEEFAPETADTLTMSGCIMNSVFEDSGAPVSYEAPEWVTVLPAGRAFGRNIEGIGPVWWNEAPNDLDDVYDAELARDELFRVMLAYFNYLKNLWEEKEKAANYTFAHMPYLDAKRESRRMVGDYILTQNDCVQGRVFEDVIAHSGWPIDLHHPRGMYSGSEGPFFSNCHVPMVQIPYRCTYSANIENLFAAGRNISTTHVGMGTTRVQATIAEVAQAVGTAVAMCLEKGVTPRQLGQQHIAELQQRLLKDDAFIPGLRNTDERDLARGAGAAASSVCKTERWWNHLGLDGDLLPMDRQRATFMARGVSSSIPFVYLRLCNHTAAPLPLTIHLRLQADPDGYTAAEDARVVTQTVPPGESWVEYPVDITTTLRYIWLFAGPAPGLSWRVQHFPPLDWTRSERLSEAEGFENIRWQSHCVSLEKPCPEAADCGPQNLVNGYSRIHSSREYAWVSDSALGLPQWAELALAQPAVVNEIHLTFDSDMGNPAMPIVLDKIPPRLVTAYTLSVYADGGWAEVANVQGNYLRKRVHAIPPQRAEKIRLTVTASGDGQTARVFEMRAYGPAR